jgi:hypothetical protein
MDMISRRRDVCLGLSQSIFSINLFFSRVIDVSISSVLVLPIIAVVGRRSVHCSLHMFPNGFMYILFGRLVDLTHKNMPIVQVSGG